MILLHSSQDANSRIFLAKYKQEFKTILQYPMCVNLYPNVSKFPAVVIDVPEMIKDLSLWYKVKKTPNYKRLGMLTSEFQILNHAMKQTCGTSSGSDLMDQYIQENEIQDTDKKYWIDLCNEIAIPSCMVAFGVQWCYDLGVDCPNDIAEFNKERSISYDPSIPVLETIPAHQEIIYSETIEDVYAANQKYIDEIEARNAVYQ